MPVYLGEAKFLLNVILYLHRSLRVSSNSPSLSSYDISLFVPHVRYSFLPSSILLQTHAARTLGWTPVRNARFAVDLVTYCSCAHVQHSGEGGAV